MNAPGRGSADAPLGVFDSGLGGLTVAAALRRVLPRERIVYLGDTARVPYGTRSAETVVRYARGCAKLLIERGAKVDTKDAIFRSTPLGWADYCEKPDIAAYLRSHGAPR